MATQTVTVPGLKEASASAEALVKAEQSFALLYFRFGAFVPEAAVGGKGQEGPRKAFWESLDFPGKPSWTAGAMYCSRALLLHTYLTEAEAKACTSFNEAQEKARESKKQLAEDAKGDMEEQQKVLRHEADVEAKKLLEAEQKASDGLSKAKVKAESAAEGKAKEKATEEVAKLQEVAKAARLARTEAESKVKAFDEAEEKAKKAEEKSLEKTAKKAVEKIRNTFREVAVLAKEKGIRFSALLADLNEVYEINA